MMSECEGWQNEYHHETDQELFVVLFMGLDIGEDETSILCQDCIDNLKSDDMWLRKNGRIYIYDYDFSELIERNR